MFHADIEAVQPPSLRVIKEGVQVGTDRAGLFGRTTPIWRVRVLRRYPLNRHDPGNPGQSTEVDDQNRLEGPGTVDDPVGRNEHEHVLRENAALREQIECLRKDIKTLVTLLLSPCGHGEEREFAFPSREPTWPGTITWRKLGTGMDIIMNDLGQELRDGTSGYYLPFDEPRGEVPN